MQSRLKYFELLFPKKYQEFLMKGAKCNANISSRKNRSFNSGIGKRESVIKWTYKRINMEKIQKINISIKNATKYSVAKINLQGYVIK